MTMISKLTTAAGTTVTKSLVDKSRFVKEIKYAPNSKLSQLGIGSVVLTRSPGDSSAYVVVRSVDGRAIMGGLTKTTVRGNSITAQLKEYIAAAKTLLDKGSSLK